MTQGRRLLGFIGLTLYGVFVASVMIALLLNYNPIPELVPKLKAVTAWLMFIVGYIGMGDWIGRLFRWKFSKSLRLSDIVFRFAIGSGLSALIVLVSCWAIPGSIIVKLYLLSTLSVVAGIAFIIKSRPLLKKLVTPATALTRAEIGLLFVAAAGALIALITAFSPITYYDSLVYHLALPETYLRLGSVQPITENLYSYFPANIEMIFLHVMGVAPEHEYVINLIGWTYALAASVLIFEWSREIANATVGYLAAALWWVMPPVLFLSVGAYVDVPLAFFTLSALYSFHRNGTELTLCGVLCGLACGIKYTAAITPFILALLIIFQSRERRFQRLLAFGISAAVVFSPWLLKNWIAVRNPVFPFLYRWLGKYEGWNQETAAGYFQLLTEYGSKSGALKDMFFLPWNIGTKMVQFGGGFDVLGDIGWQIVFVAFLAIFLGRREMRFLLLYSAGHLLLWWFSKPVLRFLVPWLPVGIILSAFALNRLAVLKIPLAKAIAYFSVVPFVIINIFSYFVLTGVYLPFHVPLGYESREQYVARKLPHQQAFTWFNNNLPVGTKVLILGEQRLYGLKTASISSNFFAPSILAKWANAADSETALGGTFTANGIDYLVVNEGELARLGGLPAFGFTEKGIANLGHFLQRYSAQEVVRPPFKVFKIDAT